MCSHIASILFYLEAVVRIQGTQPTCSMEKYQWIIPAYLKNAEYLPIKDIDFTSFQGKKKKLHEEIHEGGNDAATAQQTAARGKKSTESEMETLFANLSIGGSKLASHISLSYHSLLQVCQFIEIELTFEMVQSVEKATRSQSNSKP